jgi:hypothetical protein
VSKQVRKETSYYDSTYRTNTKYTYSDSIYRTNTKYIYSDSIYRTNTKYISNSWNMGPLSLNLSVEGLLCWLISPNY